MAFAPEERKDIAVLLGERFACFHVVAYAGKPLEILSDIGPGLLALDPELVGEPERRDAIDNPEIDGLGATAHIRRHALDGNSEHL